MSKRGRTDALDDDTDVEQLLQTPGEPTALTMSVVKMKLASFSKNDRLRKVIDTITIDFTANSKIRSGHPERIPTRGFLKPIVV
jgi:hypothetical protein